MLAHEIALTQFISKLSIQNLQGGLAENGSRIIVLNLNCGCLTATETVFAVCCMMHQP